VGDIPWLFVEEVENHVDVQPYLSGHGAIPGHQLVNELLELSKMLSSSGPDDLCHAARHSTERVHPYLVSPGPGSLPGETPINQGVRLSTTPPPSTSATSADSEAAGQEKQDDDENDPTGRAHKYSIQSGNRASGPEQVSGIRPRPI
jgi:hypothetical protein